MNKFPYILTLIFSFLVLSISAQNRLSEWEHDLEFFHQELEKKHIDLYNKVSKNEFVTELQLIKNSIQLKSDMEIVLDLMKLTRKIGDGHTAISLQNIEKHYFPFEIKWFEGDWRIVKATQQYSHLLGKKLVMVGDSPISVATKKISQVAQFVENEQSEMVRTAQYFKISEILFQLGLIKQSNKATFTFETDNAPIFREEITALRPENNTEYIEMNIVVPQIKKPQTAALDSFWFAPVENTNALYIHFEKYPGFENMQVIGEELVTYIFEHQIRQLIIDMRNNGGGDLYTGLVLAYALNLADPVDWKNGVYVLTDGVTFSAATSNAALFKQLLNAKIIGEETGSNPTGYQDMDTFKLPNSNLVVCYSKRFFKIQGIANQGIQPDVKIHYSWESYSKGTDNMLEWVISTISLK
ncbi:S41 family peptidase [uncultured Draconibacterium sp.]|uniref:S41 family peptidase n=1 Tax=uncultured Draconibacterium sp. TaxID=1573823 RepID=UPI0025D26C57|nr:S41 family peptidase [uncultured Draconibacterium sp.]